MHISNFSCPALQPVSQTTPSSAVQRQLPPRFKEKYLCVQPPNSLAGGLANLYLVLESLTKCNDELHFGGWQQAWRSLDFPSWTLPK